MKLFILTIVDSVRPISQTYEIWGQQDATLAQAQEKARELVQKYIKVYDQQKPLILDANGNRMYYASKADESNTINPDHFMEFKIIPDANFNFMDRNAISEYI